MLVGTLTLGGCANQNNPSSILFTHDRGSDQRIIGGTKVSDWDPIGAMTAALYNAQRRSLCTGTIIAEDLLLTAAHCIPDGSFELYVLFGKDTSQSSRLVARTVSAVRVGPLWEDRRTEEFDNGDIALVRFDGGLPEGYHAAEILEDEDLLSDGTELVMAGYGVIDGSSGADGGVLRKVSLPIEDATYSETEFLVDESLGRGTCYGDSGGPAFVRSGGRYLLAGVTSRAVGEVQTDDPCARFGVYTNVLAYSSWLVDTAEALSEYEFAN